jgi:hypothetical protein
MAILDALQVAVLCHDAGFAGEALVTALAVAKAESGFDTDAVGDAGLVDDTWAPSIGLFQIRCLHAERGTGGARDELANHDPAHNARSAIAISAGGRSFRPWSAFTSGAYARHLAEVRPACVSVDPTVAGVPADAGDDRPMLGQGDRGPGVADLQRRLTAAGFPCEADGVFGPLTAAAVEAFQASVQLDVDALVGPRTWAALDAVSVVVV